MLTKSLGLCLLAIAMPRPAAPQTSPDMQTIIERLDKLEDENHKLLDEIRALRTELKTAQSPDPAAPAPPGALPQNDERLAVQESRTADLDQSKVSASQRFPISLTGMLLFNAFENGQNGGGAQYPETASATPAAATDGAFRSPDYSRPQIQRTRSSRRRQGQRLSLHGFLLGRFGSRQQSAAHSHRRTRSDLEEHHVQRWSGQADHFAQRSVVVRAGGRIAVNRGR
jgi:hypothetical protein